ncbi:MAG: hypothetical protein A2138_01335 [Deltaproteobacteria bacterium RBG_16_71_12]|nr:MAG: hypothetical protein A2138_01335 [Deltaproteobacteria bacterium RBG_16_71_12]
MRRALVAALLAASCATPSPREQHEATRQALAAFSSSLAQVGMSVPLPPRVCEEPRGAPRWDDDVGCLDGDLGDPKVALEVYARALVRERLGGKPEQRAAARAAELADAYLRHDERFASLAVAIERDFDARRAADKGAPKKPAPKKPAGVDDKDHAAAKPDGKHDASTPMSDAGPAIEPEAPTDAGVPGDAGVVLTVRDRLVGTWVVEMPGPVQNVYHLCADGRARVKPESSVAAIAELIGEMPATRGTWEVTEGEPPKIAFVWAEGERLEGEITSLSAESVTIDYGDETVTAARRSASATCE